MFWRQGPRGERCPPPHACTLLPPFPNLPRHAASPANTTSPERHSPDPLTPPVAAARSAAMIRYPMIKRESSSHCRGAPTPERAPFHPPEASPPSEENHSSHLQPPIRRGA